jgi:hypothetical protein
MRAALLRLVALPTLRRASLAVALGSLASLVACGAAPVEPGPDPLDIPNEPDCDPLVPEVCAMPFPNSKWLEPDAARATGFTLAFGPTTLPATITGVHIDPEPYRRLDGFGVGAAAQAFFEGLDPAVLPDETRVADTLEGSSTVQMFEVTESGLERIPCWAELDQTAPLDSQRALTVRPAVLLREGTRYVVALQNLTDREGAPIAPSDAFVALRDGRSEGTPVADRQAHFDELFGLLEGAGLDKEALTLAWDWTTASSEAMHGPMLHMRDEAFAALGDASPAITVTSVETYSEAENARIAYEVRGTFAVPDYTTPVMVNAQPGYVLAWGADGLPTQTGTYQAEFRARIPRSALTGEPHGVVVHGHGLNGEHGQIRAGHFDELAHSERFVIVGCNMIGMSNEDVPTIIEMLSEMSNFPVLSDRLQQAVLNHAFLVRAMKKGFDKVPEVAATGLVIDPDAVFYNGISQGGIFGATHMAMSLDVERGHLGVPGNNYSTLLQRSSNFGIFFVALSSVYQDPRDLSVLLSTIQNLWDSVDPVSHYRHLRAEPFPGTPAHDVLLASATGDYQVALVTNEIVARSGLGVELLTDYGKDVPLVTPVAYPHVGSGLVNYSFGNPWPAPGNVPPNDDFGDPHGKPRKLAWHDEQMVHFYRTGEILDVCGGDGCTPD